MKRPNARSVRDMETAIRYLERASAKVHAAIRGGSDSGWRTLWDAGVASSEIRAAVENLKQCLGDNVGAK